MQSSAHPTRAAVTQGCWDELYLLQQLRLPSFLSLVDVALALVKQRGVSGEDVPML